MTEEITVRHVTFPGDWEGLYVGGELVVEDHSIDVGTVLQEVEGHVVVESSSGWRQLPEGMARAPEKYKDIPDS